MVVEYLQVAVSLVVRERLVDVVPIDSAPVGAPEDRTGAVLSTVMVIADEMVVLFVESLATAVSACKPSATAVESHVTQ